MPRTITALILLSCLALATSCARNEPTFKGKSFSEWLRLADDQDPGTSAAAMEALTNFPDYHINEVLTRARKHDWVGKDDFMLAHGDENDRSAALAHIKAETDRQEKIERDEQVEQIKKDLPAGRMGVISISRIKDIKPPAVELVPVIKALILSGQYARHNIDDEGQRELAAVLLFLDPQSGRATTASPPRPLISPGTLVPLSQIIKEKPVMPPILASSATSLGDSVSEAAISEEREQWSRALQSWAERYINTKFDAAVEVLDIQRSAGANSIRVECMSEERIRLNFTVSATPQNIELWKIAKPGSGVHLQGTVSAATAGPDAIQPTPTFELIGVLAMPTP